MDNRRTFLARAALAVAAVVGAGGLVQTARAETTYYVHYSYYMKKKNGVVTRILSGKAGPYYTRTEAQSVCNDYNSRESNSGGVRYYYSAKVHP